MRTGNLIMKCMSVFVALSYFFGVIGIDVHSCSASGEVFAVSAIRQASCHDLHAGHHHSCCGECGGHDASCHDEDGISCGGCCSDNLLCLSVTGIDTDAEHDSHHDCACVCGHCPLSAEFSSASIPSPEFPGDSFHPAGHRFLRQGDPQSILNIWRL